MPRLPGFESLGGNQTDATRPTGSYDVSPLARGGQAIAQGVETLGRGVSKVGDDVAEVLRKQNQSLFLNAHANIASGLANLNTSFVGDKDYATLQQRYNDQAQALIKQNAETIPPGNYRTHFIATANELVAHGGTAIAHQAYGGLVKADDDQLKLELDKATDDINKNPGNPMRGAQIDALGLRVDNAVNNGWKTPEEGDLLKRDIAIKTRTAELQLLATHGIVPNPDLAVRPKAGEQEDAIMRASARSGIPEDTLRNIAKPSPIDSSINPMTMYHFNAIASTAETRRQADELKLGRQRAEVAADQAVLGKSVPAVVGLPTGSSGLSPVAEVWSRDNRVALQQQGIPTNITSAFRDPEHNAQVGGARGSQHLHGNAIDIPLTGLPPEQQQAVVTQFLNDPRTGGVGYYPNSNSIHFDVREGDKAAWGTDYHGTSVGQGWPSWLTNQVTAWQGTPRDTPAAAGTTNAVMTQSGVQPGPAMLQAQSASMVEQRSAAMREAYSNPSLQTDEERMYAMQKVKQRFDLMQVATNQTENERKEIINHAADQYTQQMWDGLHTPNFDWVTFAGQINHDPALEGAHEIREKLMERVAKYSGEEKTVTFGPQIMDIKSRVLSDPGTPGHIGSMVDVYRLPPGALTAAGEKEIGNIIAAVKKSPDEAALQKAKAGMEQYAKLTMSRERDLGPVKLADPKGELKFHGDFLPQFNAEYSKWVSDSKNNPWDFLTKDNVNKIIDRVYPPKERAMDAAVGGGADKPEAPNAPLPPAPKDIQPENWEKAVVKPPLMDNGQPMTHARWAGILNKLLADPSEETMAALDAHLGDSGYTAQQLLKTLDPNRTWEKQGGKEFPTGAAAAAPESLEEVPPGSVGGVPFSEGMGLAAGSKASPKEMSEFQRQQQDPNNPAVRFRKFLETGMHPEAVKEKRHPEDVEKDLPLEAPPSLEHGEDKEGLARREAQLVDRLKSWDDFVKRSELAPEGRKTADEAIGRIQSQLDAVRKKRHPKEESR